MTDPYGEFIPLDRTFHDLALEENAGDSAAMIRLLGQRKALHWRDLLAEFRVILLSEAGSGKTAEIRNAALDLRKQGKPAFFIRIEHVTRDFEDAFEEGSLDEFDTWCRSGAEGWLLLDSVDEARLRDPKDFELAVRKIGRRISPVLQQTHIIITGRTVAWRAKTDLMLCRTALPYRRPEETPVQNAEGDSSDRVPTKRTKADSSLTSPFRILALDDLHGPQIDAFLEGRNINDKQAFRDAVERKDAWSLTTRPLDLTELVEFWREHKRIGSRLELMKSSIERRLEERDQNRLDARPITSDRVRIGARLVAAATTLCQESAIRVPDGNENAKGLAIRETLTDWTDLDCSTLLGRPIFDEAIYGAVRFHHRSVREYLAAEWLHGLMIDDGSRARVEGLFFRSQYGIDVIVPTMRPILPWLVILDRRILSRVSQIAPEIIFEGGDPSHLPLDTRRQILRHACEQLAQPAQGQSLTDYKAIQRFANTDLTDEIKALLAEHNEDDNIVWFLLRMIWQGQIFGAAKEAKHYSLVLRSKYTRTAAFRALLAVGRPSDQEEVRKAFLAETGDVDRGWLSELIAGLTKDKDGVTWLLSALRRTPAKGEFEVDHLSESLAKFIDDLPLPYLSKLIAGLHKLLLSPPVVERRHCDISQRYGWMALHSAKAISRLIDARDEGALKASSLSILRRLPNAQDYGNHDIRDLDTDLRKRVALWPELSHRLFWLDVAETRSSRDKKKGERLVDFWDVGVHTPYWTLSSDSFDRICDDIRSRDFLDDRLVALTLAFHIYRQNNRPKEWRANLKRLTNDNASLRATLNKLLHPPAQGKRTWRQEEKRWKRQAAQEAARREQNRREWKQYLIANVKKLKAAAAKGIATQGHHYLHERMRESDERSSNKWSEGNWKSLSAEFGLTVAKGFRDDAKAFWRNYRPKMRSEGAPPNTTPFATIFGLTGLEIEAQEAHWPNGLSRKDAKTATKYAIHELNGFPNWLPKLYAAFPEVVLDVVVIEIEHELATEVADQESHYVLHDISWNGEWMWDRLAEILISRRLTRPKNFRNLRYILTIIQGSSLADATIARLAREKVRSSKNIAMTPIWFAAWAGVEPKIAVPALAAHLAALNSDTDRTLFAMRFITNLVGGGSRDTSSARQGYRKVEHMKSLYLMMHQYVAEKDDIERAGKGVYSPGLRDDAQNAREALLTFIRETPGKDAFLALGDIARVHPTESSRPWLALHAKNKATRDADIAAWSPRQVRDFHDELELTPSNHRELWHLAIDRLIDLKRDLENGDASIASILRPVKNETEIRKFIGGWCRDRARGRYAIPQEEELADVKRPDLRFHGAGFDAPVPMELKLADKWTGPHLFERLENQLCGDYLRDPRSTRGIFALVYHGVKRHWDLPNGKRVENFQILVEALQKHWLAISPQFPTIEDISVLGIDLTLRDRSPTRSPRKAGAKRVRKQAQKKKPSRSKISQRATARRHARAPLR